MEHLTKTAVCKRYGIPTYETSVHYDNTFGCLRIYYHETAIATIYDSGKVKIDNGGWCSATTKKRINAILSALELPYSIVQKNYSWYLLDYAEDTETLLLFGKSNWNGATPGIWFDTNTKALVP